MVGWIVAIVIIGFIVLVIVGLVAEAEEKAQAAASPPAPPPPTVEDIARQMVADAIDEARVYGEGLDAERNRIHERLMGQVAAAYGEFERRWV